MDRGDKLNGPSLQGQSSAAISKLQADTQALNALKTAVSNFNAGHELKGTSISGMKQQLSDYLTVIDAEITANDVDVEDFQTLSSTAGGEVIDGTAILDEWDSAKEGKASAERSADNARGWASFFRIMQQMDTVRILENNAKVYDDQANTWQEIINWCQEQTDKFDQIQSATDGLFVTGAALRDATTSALVDIKGAFHVNGYAPNMNASWRYVLPIDKENIVIVRKLLELGYTEKEIENLRRAGVEITLDDLKHLESTVDTEKVFISDDCTALFYKGKVYVISVPSKEVTIGPIWNNDGSITMTDWDFDLVAGITGISLEDIPKDKLRTRDNSHQIQDNIIGGADKNAKYAAGAAVIMGISTFTKSALNHSEITLTFSSSGGNQTGEGKIVLPIKRRKYIKG